MEVRMNSPTFKRITLLLALIFLLTAGNIFLYAGKNVQKQEKAEAEKSAKKKEPEQLEKE
jgi:preprotein translocase subunit SecG